MRITIDVDSNKQLTTVTLPDDWGTIEISSPTSVKPAPVQLAMTDRHLVGVNAVPEIADQVLDLQLNWDVEPEYLARMFEAAMSGIELDDARIPKGVISGVSATYDHVVAVLNVLGYKLTKREAAPAKKRPAKARHRFDSKLADVPFTVEFAGAKATVFWRKAKEMEIAAGAQLRQDPAMNKDGSPSYGMKYGDKLRDDHSDAIDNFVTVKPVTLRSVNEVGLFLYYGDTNSWLQLVNADGQTLGEITEVK